MTTEWQPIATAPKYGPPVLLRFRSELELPERARGFADRVFVGIYRGKYSEWTFHAPVGQSGIPDEWLASWHPLPAPPAAGEPK